MNDPSAPPKERRAFLVLCLMLLASIVFFAGAFWDVRRQADRQERDDLILGNR